MSDQTRHSKVIIRNMTKEDISKIVELQKAAFPYMAAEGVYWKPEQLESHLKVFPEGQFVADYDGKIVGSCSSLIVKFDPEYKDHSWKDACGDSTFTAHNPKGDSLYGADISTHPDNRRLGVATKIYDARKKLAINLNLRRIIAGARLFNYCEFAKELSPLEYVQKVLKHEIREPVLEFQVKNGFKFIKILNDYMKDPRSLNHATFIEWINPNYTVK